MIDVEQECDLTQLRELIERRRAGPFYTREQSDDAVEAMLARKRNEHGLEKPIT